MIPGTPWRRYLARARTQAGDLLAGGAWSAALPAPVRRNLRWFSLDGLFAQVVEAVNINYTGLYVLALGATSAQIGWMTALASLSAALLLIPGGVLADRQERRQGLVLAGGFTHRTAVLLLALLPFVSAGPAGIALAIGLVVVRESMGNLILPAWTALTADIVPLPLRGRYFGTRNFAMGLASMAATLIVGQLITQLGGPHGYPLAFGLAWAAGMVSIFSFAQLRPPAAPPAPSPTPQPANFRDLLRPSPFWAFAAAAAVWNFSLNISGPFFNVYVIEGLHGDAGAVGLLAVTSALSGLPGQRLFGALADRWGPRRVQLVTGLLIPSLPLAWMFVTNPYQPVLINLAGGFLWAGFQIASFNLLLALTPEALRPRYAALYQLVVLLALAAGAAWGSTVVQLWGYRATFLMSGLGRLLAMLVFARFVPAPPRSD